MRVHFVLTKRKEPQRVEVRVVSNKISTKRAHKIQVKKNSGLQDFMGRKANRI